MTWLKRKGVRALFLILCSFSIYHFAQAANNRGPLPNHKDKEKRLSIHIELEEVYLSFKYRGIINTMVISYYNPETDTWYLPVSELFKLLKIPHQVNMKNMTVEGVFLEPENQFTFNFNQQYLEYRGIRANLKAEDYVIKELDFYLTPELLNKIFKLNFSVDFNNLSISLKSNRSMPVVEEFERQKRRNRIQQNPYTRDHYELRYGRDRSYLEGGFFDYSLTSNIISGNNLYNYSGNIGGELLGGDLEGSFLGLYSSKASSFTTQDLRWRYVMRNSPWLKSVRIGQNNTNDLFGRRFKGLKLSNEPIEPRVLFDQYVVDGTTIPKSEVELYLNNTLIDYQTADELGNYRFVIPLTYGQARLKLLIYGPDGRVKRLNKRIQIPFSFLSPGDFQYNVNAGSIIRPSLQSNDRALYMNSNASFGFTEWLTGTIGTEYIDIPEQNIPQFYSSISSRIATQYLLNADIAPNAFYRLSGNVIYPSAASIGLDYTYYADEDIGIYNRIGDKQNIQTNLFYPLNIGNVPLSIRLSTEHGLRSPVNNTRYRFDLRAQIQRAILQVGYTDQQFGELEFRTTPIGRFTSSITYRMSRSRNISTAFRSALIRSQLTYIPSSNKIEKVDFEFSRDLFDIGRIRLTGGRDLLRGFNFASLNLTFNLGYTRSNSTARVFNDDITYTQNFRGSVGFDSQYKDFILDDRHQVGRSGASVVMFVDENNSGSYDEGEKVIKNNAVRIGQSGGSQMDKEGIIRLTQLKSYNRLDLEINKAVLQNPLYVPEIEQFSFITDPNQYKPIEIPFYITGILEGRVQRMVNDSTNRPVSGLRLFLNQQDGSFYKELTSFSDGAFYTYEIPPGNYTLEIDSTQTGFLNAVPEPGKYEIEIESKPGGHYIGDLNFLLKPQPQDTTEPITSIETSAQASTADTSNTYSVQLASFSTRDNAEQAVQAAEKLFNETFTIKFNSKRGLYAVRTQPMNDKQAAVNKLFDISNSQFRNPVLVLRPKKTAPVIESAPAIQLGAFSTEERASRFVSTAQSSMDLEPEIYYDKEKKLYIVVSSLFESTRQAVAKINEINSRSGFEEIFVVNREYKTEPSREQMNFTYRVQIEGVTPNAEKAYLDAITTGEVTDTDIREGPKRSTVTFDVEKWENTLGLRDKLEKISTIGRPYILIIERDN